MSKVTNSATGDGYPAVIELEYDADGHMIRDEEERVLEYDALGRLTHVSALSGETPSDYRYDPLDKLAGLDDGGGQEQRFYQNGELANRIQGINSSTFMRGDGVVFAEHQAGADPKSLMLASDHKNTVLREVGDGSANDIAYSAYGHRSAKQPVSTHLGYNGVLREAQTGCYLLGNGYRAYNPCLMRFHSPDSLSPFGEGGVNAYVYCGGDPMSNVDPDGHNWLSGLWKRISGPFRTSPVGGAPKQPNTRKQGNDAASLERDQKPGVDPTIEKVEKLTQDGYQANRDLMDQWTRKKQNPNKIQAAAAKRREVVGAVDKLENELIWAARKKYADASYEANAVSFNPSGGVIVTREVRQISLRDMVDPNLQRKMATLRQDVGF